jgi:adenine deaminase
LRAPAAVAFIRGFGLRHGALASSVAHDSHNLIAVGADDDSLARAINLLIPSGGGICAVAGPGERAGRGSAPAECVLPLPIAGLMSVADGYATAAAYATADRFAKRLGSTLAAPFMTLSFMALLVIPDLKLSDRGLFSGATGKFVPLQDQAATRLQPIRNRPGCPSGPARRTAVA